MLPLLQFLSDKEEHEVRDIAEKLSDKFNLSEEERRKLLSSGSQTVIYSRTSWARTYLFKAGLLHPPKRGYVKITDRGLDVLKKNPEKIDKKFLYRFPEFVKFRSIKKEISKDPSEKDEDLEDLKTPQDLMDEGYKSIKADLTQDLLEKLRSVDPSFFEKIIVDLLSAMGYGKSRVTKRSHDGGIDGEVDQDKLGLDKIIFQAKRYAENNPVTASNVRDFVGTLHLPTNGANKGIFVTTSRFPSGTEDILKGTLKNIVLIDGIKLAELMIEHNVGVSKETSYQIKKIDSDFFP